eukprot:3304653-Karenia_brevis.AAC.1
MAKALLSECASCNTAGFVSSQVRVHTVDGQELYQCQKCYVECRGKEITATRWRNTVRRSKNFAYFVDRNTMTLRTNGGQGEHAVPKRFYMDNKTFVTCQGKEFTFGTWIRSVQQVQTVPRAAEALQLLHDVHEAYTQ